jgi:hypothetical protein
MSLSLYRESPMNETTTIFFLLNGSTLEQYVTERRPTKTIYLTICSEAIIEITYQAWYL